MWTGTYADVAWVHFLDLDPEQLAEARETQLLALARYGRCGGAPDEHLGWGDAAVSTVRRLFDRLNKLLAAEGAAARADR